LFVVAGTTVYWLRRDGKHGETKDCRTPVPSPEVIRAINAVLAKTQDSSAARAAGSVTITVHFHIIQNASGKGHVTSDAVDWQIAVLNAAFSGTAGPAFAQPANTPFRFSRGTVETITNTDWFNMSFNELSPSTAEKEAMARNIGGKSELNIYTALLDGAVAGWARVPYSLTVSASPVLGLNGVALDGVVLRYSTLPTAAPSHLFDQGDTATHEVGHWLGLFHVFQSGCGDPGDYVSDTTFQAGIAFDCTPGSDSCTNRGGTDTS
jgi:hypothetical protein